MASLALILKTQDEDTSGLLKNIFSQETQMADVYASSHPFSPDEKWPLPHLTALEAKTALPSLHNRSKVPRLSHSTSSRTLKVLSVQKSHSAFPFPLGQGLPLWPRHNRLIRISDDPQSLRSGVIGIPVSTSLAHLSPSLFQGAKPCFWTV